MTSEGEALILRKNSTKISFDDKMANKSIKGFLLTTKFYKSTNDAAPLPPKKRKTEGNAAVQTEGGEVKKQ